MNYVLSQSGSVLLVLRCGPCSSVRRSFLSSLWFLLGVCVCFLASDALGTQTGTMYVQNVGGATATFSIYVYSGGNWYYTGVGGTAAAGQTVGVPYSTCGGINGPNAAWWFDATHGTSAAPCCGVNNGNVNVTDDCAGSGENYNFTVGAAPAPTTNYYCVYHVQWTNCGSTYAQFGGVVVDGANVVRDISSMITGNSALEGMLVSPLAPGHYVDLYVTNNMGTNNLGCGSWIAGDYRDHVVECPTETGGGSKYSYTTGTYPTGGGNQSTGGGPVAGSNTNSPGGNSGGSTNLAQQKDIYKLIDANNLGLANVERGLSVVNSNVLAGTAATKLMDTNLQSTLRTNFALLSTNINSMNTNLGAMNTNLAGIATNLSGLGTNMAEVATNTEGILSLYSNSIWARSNGVYEYLTNYASLTNNDSQASNAIAGWATVISDFQGKGQSMSDGVGLWQGAGGGLEPPSDWGVLHLPGLAAIGGPPPPPGTQAGWSIDFKQALSLQFIEDRCPGFRAWLRTVLLWGALIILLNEFMQRVREAVWQVLVIPDPSGGEGRQVVRTLGFAFGGPIGQGLASVGIGVVSATTIMGILTTIMFIPSLFAAAFSTAQAISGGSVVWMASAVVTAVGGPSDHSLMYFVWLIGMWLPVIELVIFSLNYGGAMLACDALVSVLFAWMKVRPLTTG